MVRGELKNELYLPCEIASQISKPELLYLAVLFHDIGKGSGGGHSEKGAAMMPTISRRLGLSGECSDSLEFLVRQHLYFPHIAQRRDLNDEKMIIEFARQMETSENLQMLYLLTVADVRAVGADVWNTWKSLLFQELYEKAFNVIERGEFRYEASTERVKSVMNKVAGVLENEFPQAAVLEELKSMPMRLLLSNNIEIIADRVRLLLGLGDSPVLTRLVHRQENDYSEFTICTHDIPGLFSRITGVMAANGINILGAQINTCKNGKVLDTYQVNSAVGSIITDENRWSKVRNDTEKVIKGEIDVAAMVEKRQRPSVLTVRPTPRFPTRIEFDNEVSEKYTVIDIYTHDKVGLLYLITSTLTQLGLYIGVSKISTKVDQVVDVFYVLDIFGQKIVEKDKLESIRERLKKSIDEWV